VSPRSWKSFDWSNNPRCQSAVRWRNWISPRATFYRWYQRYLARGAGALGDGQPAPRRVWNKIPETVAAAVIDLALKEPELSPRELATAFVDQRQYFVS
jgi:hypothetical protein